MKRVTLSTVCAALLVAVPAMAQVPDAHRPPQDSATVGDTTDLRSIAQDSLIESDATALASMQMAMQLQSHVAAQAGQRATTEAGRKLAQTIAQDSRSTLQSLNQLARKLGKNEMAAGAGQAMSNPGTPAMSEDIMEYGSGRFVRDTSSSRYLKDSQGQYVPDTLGFWSYEVTPGRAMRPPAGVDTMGFTLYQQDVYRRGENGQYVRDTTQLYRFNGSASPRAGWQRDTAVMGMAHHDSADGHMQRAPMGDTTAQGRMNDSTVHGSERGHAVGMARADAIPNPPALGLRGALDWSQLQGKSGSDFDKAFVHQEVQGLQAVADHMRNDIQPRLRNPELKDIADDLMTNVGIELRKARDAEVALKGK